MHAGAQAGRVGRQVLTRRQVDCQRMYVGADSPLAPHTIALSESHQSQALPALGCCILSMYRVAYGRSAGL
jgi:hypothetical protein